MVAVPFTEERRLRLAKERGIIVDPEDEWLLTARTWRINADGYAVTGDGYSVPGTTSLHHYIAGHPIYEGDEIDHINHIRTDNRRCNLRYLTTAEQALNREHKRGVSGEKSVYATASGAYQVRITRKGSTHCLGTFATLSEAVAWRDDWLANE